MTSRLACAVVLMLAPAAGVSTSRLFAQTAAASQIPVQTTPGTGTISLQTVSSTDSVLKTDAKKRDSVKAGKPVQAGTLNAQRKAAKLYLKGVKLLEKQQPEAAWSFLKEAAELAADNPTYVTAAELARQSLVTELVQKASRERSRNADDGTNADAVKLLQHAHAIDPTNPLVVEHLNQMADSASGTHVGATASAAPELQEGVAGSDDTLANGAIKLLPSSDKKSFHLRSAERQMVEEVFKAYGIQATVHESVQSKQLKLDLDDVTFTKATQILSMMTHTFYEPLDPHRVVVASDTRENRNQFQRLEMETVYLPGLNDKEMTEVSNIARNVFDMQQAVIEPTAGTITLRAPTKTLDAFNKTLERLEDGKSELDLNVKVIQLAHVVTRETGATFFQQTGLYNLASEANSIISQNESAVQQIIAAGLVPNANGIANQIKIILILLAAGQLTGAPFNQGLIPFGNGLTESLASISSATLTMSLNSSDTRVLDDIHLQLADQEEGTFKIGQRYPIETSSYSSVALPAVAGISAAVAAAASQTIPQIQYEDLGLTLKATPKVMRSNDVALAIELKIQALGGAALNDIPVLNSQQVTGVLTLKAGETAILVSDLSRAESRALNGLPGLADIPGLEDVNDITRNQNVARLLILVTPSVSRNIRGSGMGPRFKIDRATPSSHSFN